MSNPGPELFKALMAFQATNPRVAKSGDNPHFRSKYITLEDLTSVARACNKHGLVFFHCQEDDACVTTLAHSDSGQYVESRVKLLHGKQSPNPQTQGSAMTYARRQGLAGLLALCDCKDDDGEAAMQGYRDDDVPFDGGGTEQPPQPEAREHHESFEAVRKAFCAALNRELDLDYNEVAMWCESIDNPRPSEMDDDQRRRLLDFLRSEPGLNRFLNWKEMR